MFCGGCRPTTVNRCAEQKLTVTLVVWSVWYAIQLVGAKQATGHASCAEHRRPESLASMCSTSGLCDHICVRTNTGHQFDRGSSDEEEFFQGVTENTQKQMVEAMREFISTDSHRARVCMGDLSKHNVVRVTCAAQLDRELYTQSTFFFFSKKAR